MTLHKTAPGTDITTAPARDGSRKGKGVSHFRYNCKRDGKEGARTRLAVAHAWLFFFVFFVFFKTKFYK